MGIKTLAEFYALPEGAQRDWIARWEISAEKCGSCGRPRSECSDPKRRFYPQRQVCFATMEEQAARRRYHDLHEKAAFHDGTFTEWAEKASGEFPYHRDDGVTIWVADRDLNPDDDFLRVADPA